MYYWSQFFKCTIRPEQKKKGPSQGDKRAWHKGQSEATTTSVPGEMDGWMILPILPAKPIGPQFFKECPAHQQQAVHHEGWMDGWMDDESM